MTPSRVALEELIPCSPVPLVPLKLPQQSPQSHLVPPGVLAPHLLPQRLLQLLRPALLGHHQQLPKNTNPS